MEPKLKDYAEYRLEKARENLKSSKLLLNNNQFAASLNRSYYSIFHATRALAAFDKYRSKTHSGLISYFIREYIHSGRIDKKFGEILKSAERIRIQSDYIDFFIVSKNDAQTQIQNAEEFLKMIENYLAKDLEK